MYKLSYLSIKKNLYPLTLLGGVRGLQIFITTYSLHTGSYYFLHSVFPKMIITTTSTKIIPNAIYTKNAGKIFSNKPIVNARIAIIDIPIPIVLHNFFSSYFSFSSFEAVLYPEMNQLPCPESKIIESTANIAKTIYNACYNT